MPFYEFRCHNCYQPLRLHYSYEAYDSAEPRCPHCDSLNVRRQIGRVAVAKSEGQRLDRLVGEDQLARLEDDNPKQIGRLMRQMSDDMGEPLGDELGEVVERLESGQTPEAIEKVLPPPNGAGAEP